MMDGQQRFIELDSSFERARMADILVPLIRYVVLDTSVGDALFIVCLITMLRD